jgi:hypothetical protein
VEAVAAYLGQRMGPLGTERLFRRLLGCDWDPDKPNIGLLIEDGAEIGGFVGAIYSRRRVRGRELLFCNIHSWHVEERFRKLSLKLMDRLLARPECTFTCFSPSERVVELLRFFKFQQVEAVKVIFAPLSGVSRMLGRSPARIFRGTALASRLSADERRIFRDHGPYRCGHLLVESEGARSYVVTVRRGRGLKAFADVLYASNPALLAECIARTHLPIGLAHRTFLTGMDLRLLDRRPGGSFVYRRSRPLMFRSNAVAQQDIDTLYSELVPMYA